MKTSISETPILDQIDSEGKIKNIIDRRLGPDWIEVGPDNSFYTQIVQRFESIAWARPAVPVRKKLIDAGVKAIYFYYTGTSVAYDPEFFMASVTLGPTTRYYWINLDRLAKADSKLNIIDFILRDF
jgi:hypothetical protein